MKTLNVILFVLLVAGCTSTVTPDLVVPTHASADGNDATSGIIAHLADGSYLVTTHFHDRYNAIVKVYGQKFVPEVKADDGIRQQGDDRWIIDRQHFDYFLKMNLWRKSAILPKP